VVDGLTVVFANFPVNQSSSGHENVIIGSESVKGQAKLWTYVRMVVKFDARANGLARIRCSMAFWKKGVVEIMILKQYYWGSRLTYRTKNCRKAMVETKCRICKGFSICC
jgi:hypothetical protein